MTLYDPAMASPGFVLSGFVMPGFVMPHCRALLPVNVTIPRISPPGSVFPIIPILHCSSRMICHSLISLIRSSHHLHGLLFHVASCGMSISFGELCRRNHCTARMDGGEWR